MAFLKDAAKYTNGANIVATIAQVDSAITLLVQRKQDLLSIKSAIDANLVDYTNADRTELNAELSRLNNAIKAI